MFWQTEQFIQIADADEWKAFWQTNREALEPITEQQAFELACNQALVIGGGAAPLFRVGFVDDEEEQETTGAWETRHDAVVLAAWETWTKNGLGLDFDEREQLIKSVRDAATNTWSDGMTDAAWYSATIDRLMTGGVAA